MPSSIVDGCGLHPRGTGSAFPNAPLKSVSKGRNDFRTTCFAFATTCKVARLPDGSDPKGPTETFTPGLSTGRSPFPPPGITTMVAGRLHRQDLHLLEHQLASLQLPKIPYGGFSPVRLKVPGTAQFSRESSGIGEGLSLIRTYTIRPHRWLSPSKSPRLGSFPPRCAGLQRPATPPGPRGPRSGGFLIAPPSSLGDLIRRSGPLRAISRHGRL